MSDSTNHAVRAPDGPRGQGNYVEGPRMSFAGGAGILSTARDYAHFLEMLRNHGEMGGVRFLSPKMVDMMTTNQIPGIYAVSGRGFGLGFETVERFGANNLSSVGTFSWGGAYASNYQVDPAEGLTIVFMINQLPNTSDVPTKFSTLVYQALVSPRAATVIQR
jgi:CubicO group peptidase (beta-lactamase class C family)